MSTEKHGSSAEISGRSDGQDQISDSSDSTHASRQVVSKATIAIASEASSTSSSNQQSPSEVNRDIHGKRNLTDLNSASDMIGASSCSLDLEGVGHDTSMSVAETGGCEILADENVDTKGMMQRQGSKYVSHKNSVCMACNLYSILRIDVMP